MDRDQMEQKHSRLEEIRAQKASERERSTQSVADEHGIDHAAQTKQEKAAADKTKDDFTRAHDGQQPASIPPKERQQDSQHIENQSPAPEPSRPDKQADIDSRRPGFDNRQAQDHEAVVKKNKSDFEEFKQREQQEEHEPEKEHDP